MHLLDFSFASVFAVVFTAVKWLILGVLVTSSQLWNRTHLAVLLGSSVLLMGVGVVFKVEHWEFADELLLLGAVVVAGSYFRWYLTKARYQLLDYFKLAWVLGAAATVVSVAVFRPLVRLLTGGTEAFFWSMALLYMYQRWIARPKRIPSSNKL
jgi:hypothetical protein